MKTNRIISCTLYFLSLSLCWAIELEPAEKKVIATFPIGRGNGALELRLGEPYEPEAPTQLLISPSGDTLVLDYYQGIVLYDPELAFKGLLPTSLYNRITLSKSLLVAWNSDSSITDVTIWPIRAGNFETPITMQLQSGQNRDLVVKDAYIFYTYSADGVLGLFVDNGKATPIMTKDLEEKAESLGFSISGNQIIDKDYGVITKSAELFFSTTSKQELVYAQAESKRDTINIASGIIFAIDSSKRRYIFYHGEGKARIAIAESNGNLFKVMDIIGGGDSGVKLSLPCLAPDGSIRYIESSKEGHKLVSIQKSW